MGLRRLLVLAVVAMLGLVPASLAAPTPLTGWLTFSNSAARTNYLPPSAGIADPSLLTFQWSTQTDGTVTAQPLVVRDLPNPGDRTVYVVTAEGFVEGINQNGYVIAKTQLGHMTLPTCSWLPGNHYGITGTPVVDPLTQTLYVADALGYVHALDATTLAERPGWPVRLFSQPSKQLFWGAINLVKGKLYLSTGSLCDRGTNSVFSVDVKTRKTKKWTSVPLGLGGGGGMWGWGGVAYDAPTSSLLVVTGDALPGGTNVTPHFNESAGYAEHLVQLSLDLKVRASNTPQHYTQFVDLDLTGTPVVMRAPNCPALVAAQGKNGRVYVWRLNAIAKGIWWSKQVAAKLNGQPAWSPATRSLYVVGQQQAYRFQITGGCKFKQVWAVPLVGASVNGPPLIVGNVIWFTVTGDQTLWTVDATTGALLWKGGLAEAAYAPPALLDGRVYEAAFRGLVTSFG
jgi:outer membrane protein assembly factor BamB